MMLTLVNAGRTGVERGAYQGAASVGIPVTGFMREAGRDELGEVPRELAQHLTACPGRSKRVPVQRAIDAADAVLVVVPDPDDISQFPVVQYVLKHARRTGRPLRVHAAEAAADDAIAYHRVREGLRHGTARDALAPGRQRRPPPAPRARPRRSDRVTMR